MDVIKALKDLIPRTSFPRRTIIRAIDIYRHHRTDCYVISHPKCGRTWLMVMLAKAFAVRFNDPRDIVWDPRDVICAVGRKWPYIQFTHDGVDGPPASAGKQYSERNYHLYRKKRVIFLIRDPRDVLVSHYWHLTLRKRQFHDSLSDFVKHPWWGIDRVIAFMEGWYEHRHLPVDFLLVRYEDLQQDAAAQLRRVLTFVNLPDISDETIRTAVDYASFENMRRMSLNELADNPRFATPDRDAPESFKVRKGKVGGYTDYLSTADMEYIEERMRRGLPAVFGYTPSRA